MRLKSHAYNRYVALVKMGLWMPKPAVFDTLSSFEYHITIGNSGPVFE
jgi:hypothetical protein